MDHSDQVRLYLREALKQHGVRFKHASEKIGRDHAYISQYVSQKDPTPLYLDESDRVALTKIYPFLDEVLLRPPPKTIPPAEIRNEVAGGQPPLVGQATQAPKTYQLLRIWDGIPVRDQDYALRIMADIRDANALRVAKSETA